MNKERGSVLAFSLLLLIGLTMIMVISLNTVVIDQKVNGNLTNYKYNNEANDAAFLEAKAWLDAQLTNPTQCPASNSSCGTIWQQRAISPDPKLQPASWWASRGRYIPGTSLNKITNQPQFVIEESTCNSINKTRTFKITTRSTDPRNSAVLFKENFVTSSLGPPLIPHTFYNSNSAMSNCQLYNPIYDLSFIVDKKGQLTSLTLSNPNWWFSGCNMFVKLQVGNTTILNTVVYGTQWNIGMAVNVNAGDDVRISLQNNCAIFYPIWWWFCFIPFGNVSLTVNGLISDPDFCH